MIRLVAFDLDGTIADTIPMCIEAFEKAVSPYAGHTLTKEEIIQTFGLNEIGMVKAVVKERWKDALRDFYIQYEKLHSQCNTPFEGTIDLIKHLKSKGIIVALITGKGEKSCKITLKKLNMKHMFSDIMTGSEFKNCKSESLLILMRKYNLSSEECLYIGDAVSDVIASKNVGITCLSAAWSEAADKEELYKINGKNVYESIQKLAGVLPLQEPIPQRQFSFPRPTAEVDPGIFNQRRSFEQPFQGCSFFVCEPLVF